MAIAVLERPRLRELHLTLQVKEGDSIDELTERLANVLKENQAAVVRQFVFGPVAAHAGAMDAMRRCFGEVNWPVTWVEGGACAGGPIAGIQIHAVGGVPIQTLTWQGRPIGRTFDDGEARHCLLGDLGPFRTTATAPDQARETFDILETALGLAGMNVKDVRRTWLFLDDILSWYGPFNAVRNAFFARSGLQAGPFPASTGVGGRNLRGAALTLNAWAVSPYRHATRIQAVSSPMQCPAIAYGSAFSRAVEIVSSHHSHLLISGTASVEPDGRTAHVGDVGRQIELTMRVVGAILQSHGKSFADVTRATAYFKSTADFPPFAAWCARYDLGELPVLSACCDICRPEFLFEIEVDAVATIADARR
jgi:enamine deaminase RidA (YjgF/YER057c/UK114 family)